MNDEGGYNTSCIDISEDGNYLATGSKMGSLNIYSLNKDRSTHQSLGMI